MKKVKVLIADDDSRVCGVVEKILNQNFVSVEVVARTDSVRNTIEALYLTKPHIAILDIHLYGGTAMEVVKETCDLDYKVIFMSAYQEYALEDIRFASIDFIYKPLDVNELIVTVDQVISGMVEEGYVQKIRTLFSNAEFEAENKQLVLNADSGIIPVAIHDIVCGESLFGRSRFYFRARKTIETSRPLRRYEAMLGRYMFCRCHMQFMINLCHVDRIDYETQVVLMNNGMTVPIDARRFAGLRRQMNKVMARDLSFTASYRLT